MKYSEFYRWLKQQGVMFEPGKGSHHIRTSVFAFHGSKEMKDLLRKKILKDLVL